MKNNLIILAKQYMKRKEWKKAIELFEEHKSLGLQMQNDDIFSFIECLLKAGLFDKAEKETLKILKNDKENEKALNQLILIYDYKSLWRKAYEVNKELLIIDSSNPNYHFSMGRVNSYLKYNEAAKKNYIEGLLSTHGMTYNKLIETMQKSCFPTIENINTHYVFLGGKNNLGAFIHNIDGFKYMTKISKHGNGSKKETTFYQEVVSQFPQIKEAIPQFINSFTINNINYLTIELVETSNQKSTIDDVIKASQILSSVSYEEISNSFPNSNYDLNLKSRANYITPFFTQIHKKEYNKNLFEKLKKFCNQKSYQDDIKEIISYLETLIMNNKLYLYIDPARHYSLLHGDFQPSNTIYDNKNKKTKIIDWPTYKIGPKFIDITRYFQASFTSLDDIHSSYLDQNKLDLIEKIFFLYAFALFHFLALKKSNMYLTISNFILPALDEMRKYIKVFTGEEYLKSDNIFNQILLNINKVINNEHNIEKKKRLKLQKENSSLKQEIKKIKATHTYSDKKLNDVRDNNPQNSKTLFKKLIDKFKK